MVTCRVTISLMIRNKSKKIMKQITGFSVRVFTLKSLLVAFLAIMSFMPTRAASKNVTMQAGETQTFYLPSSVTSKTLKSVSFYSTSISYVQVVSYTNYSVKVKAVKAFSSPIIVRCDYYYYLTSGSYTYLAKGYYDYNITVVGETKVQPTKISLPTVISVEVGESKDLVPTVTPANAEYTLTWKMSNTSVATVYQNGTITGKSVGETDLKVSADNGVYTMCRIVVYRPSPTSVSIKSTLSLTVGESATLTPSVYPSNATYTLTWSSSNTSVATVSSSGKVTAMGSGKARIIVKTSNGLNDWCDVTVSAPQAYATITEAKYATFYDTYPRDFSGTGITVYTVMYDDGASVTLKEVEYGMVPASTPVLLYKEVAVEESVAVPEGSYNSLPIDDNQLKVSDGTSALGANVYVLANKSAGIGFYHWAADHSLTAGRVYLQISDMANTREFLDLEDDYTTLVESVPMLSSDKDVYYDMSGHRVAIPTKGIYVVCSQGKKSKLVILK